MKLLYVTEGSPTRDPRFGDGSSLISFEVIRHLPADVLVTLLTFDPKIPIPDEIHARCQSVTVLRVRDHRVALATSVASGLSVGALQRATRRAAHAVRELSSAVDVTLVHGPHALFLTSRVRGPVVVQVVDPWSLRVAMESEMAAGWRRRYRTFKSWRATAVERRLPQRARLLTVSQRDAHAWSARLGRPVTSLANGADAPPSSGERVPGPPTVCFVGSLNYAPNVESAIILIEELAPAIWEQEPTTRFLLAGRQPDPRVLSLAGDRVHVLANVASMQDVFAASDVAVFPDRHGLGIRNSVSEALAAGLPVVATPAAAREQPPHPLLHIAGRDPELVADVIGALRGCSDGPGRTAETPTLRTWDVVATEYLAQCRLAAEAAA